MATEVKVTEVTMAEIKVKVTEVTITEVKVT
jgi:hypothetical protein